MTAQVSCQDRRKSRLEIARRAQGLSREQLAVAAGISSRTVARIERGHRTPYRATLQVLALALGIELADLLQDDERRASEPAAVKEPGKASRREAG